MTVLEYFNKYRSIDISVDGDIYDCEFSDTKRFLERHGNKEISSVSVHGCYHKIVTKKKWGNWDAIRQETFMYLSSKCREGNQM